jgi:hypothetical protein
MPGGAKFVVDAVQNLQEPGIDDRLEAGRTWMQPLGACQSVFRDGPKLGPLQDDPR